MLQIAFLVHITLTYEMFFFLKIKKIYCTPKHTANTGFKVFGLIAIVLRSRLSGALWHWEHWNNITYNKNKS